MKVSIVRRERSTGEVIGEDDNVIDLAQLREPTEPQVQHRGPIIPWRFQEDPVTGVFWPPFWNARSFLHAALSEKERDAELLFTSPSFVLIPLSLIEMFAAAEEEEKKKKGFTADFTAGPPSSRSGASEPIFRAAITTEVLEGAYHSVATAEEQAFFQRAATASPFLVDRSEALKRAFTELAVRRRWIVAVNEKVRETAYLPPPPPTRIVFNVTADAEYLANPKSVAGIGISLSNLRTGELSTARMMLPVNL